ncbi:MAG: hypothetical protein LBJ71_01520 [Holosporaceae bacterium]|jgi:hypothetical protein|nr:hypothetical protein [Holosporaceae bacterium]
MKKISCIGIVLTCLNLHGMLVPVGDTRIDRWQNSNARIREVGGRVAQLPQQRAVQRIVARTDLQHNFAINGDSVCITFRDRDEDGISINTYTRDYPLVAEIVAGRYYHNCEEGFSRRMQHLYANIGDISTLRGDRKVLVRSEPNAEQIPHRCEILEEESPSGRALTRISMRDGENEIVICEECIYNYRFVLVCDGPLVATTREQLLKERAEKNFPVVVFQKADEDRRRYLKKENFQRSDGSFYSVDGAERVGGHPKPRPAPAFNPSAPFFLKAVSIDDLWMWPYRPLRKALMKMKEMSDKYNQ